jgi:ABC-type transporter Mla subunit MlaD
MELENVISELKTLLVEKKFSEEAVASMTSTFAEAIKQKDEQYRNEIDSAKSEKEAIAKEHSELKESVDSMKSQLAEAQDKIQSFEAVQQAQVAVAAFNERMDVIDQKYDLDDSDREFLASELKTLELTEEAFASFQDKLSILWNLLMKIY